MEWVPRRCLALVPRRRRLLPAGLVGILLMACSSPASTPSATAPGNAATSTRSALQLWAAFPVNASPRPIVPLRGLTSGPAFFPDGSSKLAFIDGAFDRPAELPPSPGMAAGYPIISADQAFSILRPAGNKAPADATRLRITRVQLGAWKFATDRGDRTLPAWLFWFGWTNDSAAVLAYNPAAVLAVAPPRQWFPAGAPIGSEPSFDISVSVGTDDRTMTVHFTGAKSDVGPCGVRYEVQLAESSAAVVLTFLKYPNSTTATCTLEGYARQVSARLRAPLGARVVVDPTGAPLAVTSHPS
jgi:hypothetical protein